MADRIITMAQNGRHSLKGLFWQSGHPALFKDENETLTITVDWTRFNGSATVSTSTWATEDNVTLSGAASTTTQASVKLSGDPGDVSRVTNTMTASDGTIKQVSFDVYGRDA